MLKTLLIAAAMVAFPSAAWAQDWAFVTETSTGVNYLDRESVTTEDGIVTLWIKTDYHPDIQAQRNAAGVRSREQIDCAGSRIRLMDYIPFDKDGTELRHDKFESGTEWMAIEPGTFAKSKQDMVCGSG
ncbi:MAG: surface-adhesin E family protein [Sphingomonas sp.]